MREGAPRVGRFPGGGKGRKAPRKGAQGISIRKRKGNRAMYNTATEKKIEEGFFLRGKGSPQVL